MKPSRQKLLSDQERVKQAAALASRKIMLEDEERQKFYRPAELKGLKVMHGASSFEAGEIVILTLADAPILKRGERGRLVLRNPQTSIGYPGCFWMSPERSLVLSGASPSLD